MGKSKIEWTEKVWNPVTGCTKVSDGCKYCYADRMFPRVYGNTNFSDDGKNIRPRKFTDIKLHHDRIEQPLCWKKPSMIFVNSMSDLFHKDVPFEFIANIYDTMCLYPLVCRKKDCAHEEPECLMDNSEQNHIYQILTKRPKRAKEFYDNMGYYSDPFEALSLERMYGKFKNIWLGVSVENQKTADERIPILLQVPAKVRWLSVEPLLEPIDIKRGISKTFLDNIHWVVIGAESKGHYPGRICKIEWIEYIVDQCKRANVPVFVKQIHLNNELIKNINRFPRELQIREYPK